MTGTQPEQDSRHSSADEAQKKRRLFVRAFLALRIYVAHLLRVEDEHKPKIYVNVFRGTEFTELNYWLETFFSIGIATLGLIINSPAVVIGAMLISPLMGPIIANGLALALGDFYLGIKSFLSILLSILVSVCLAAVITWVLPFHTPTPEILARVQPTLLDLAVAILSGAAGAIVVCRGGSGGGVTALPGVAVAVALMPPLGVVGFGVGIGWDWTIIRGGGLLFLTNLVAIILTSFVVFFSVRMDAPAARREINEWLDEEEKGDRLYDFVMHTPLRPLLGKVGSLPRRLLILAVFMVTVSLPLGQTLSRLREEAQIRRAVFAELHNFIPRDAIFQEDLGITEDSVKLRVVAVLPKGFSSEKRLSLEKTIQGRAGRETHIVVYDVATRAEVAELAGRFTPAAPPVLMNVDEARTRVWMRVKPAVEAAWPSGPAPLLSYDLTFQQDSPDMFLHLAYLSEEELGPLGEAAVRKALGEGIGSTSMQARFERVHPQESVQFRGGSFVLSKQNKSDLDSVAATLARFSRARCVIMVPVSKSKSGAALGERRAEQVRKYLSEDRKIVETRIQQHTYEGANDVVLLKILTVAP